MNSKNLIIIGTVLSLLLISCDRNIRNPRPVDRQAAIFPDYSGLVIPPNIAPLNFKIMEEGEAFEVRLAVDGAKPVIVRSGKPEIQFNLDKWHKLLKVAKGKILKADIFVKDRQGRWNQFQPIIDTVSAEEIDNHLAYRLINTGYILWNQLGIYQRNLENFNEKPILENNSFEYGCLNCHSFAKNNPDFMLLHTRAKHGGTIISRNGKLEKIDTKAANTISAGVYPSWNPDGRHIAFSLNRINQHFASGPIRIEVSDEVSDLAVYDIDKNTITTCPSVSGMSRENLPAWSPDGKFLYFISTGPATTLGTRIYDKYDLLCIGFDPATDTWGQVDTVLSSGQTGMSISFPKVSPDGKFLMFCGSDHGYFTIHHPLTDLYLMDLETREYHKMEINSSQTDSYHCFSSRGHWFVFSSKRMDGLFTRPFFSYLDSGGHASKPFVLPQKDPDFYSTFTKNYNIPELITGEVKVSPLDLRDELFENPIPARLDSSVDSIYLKEHVRQ